MLMFLLNNFWLVAGFSLTAIAGLVLITDKPKWNDFLAFGLIIGSLITAYATLHPRQTPLMDEAKKVQEMIGAGTPVLLEFQSPY